MAVTKSAKLFLERAGLILTHRAPVSRTVPSSCAIHQVASSQLVVPSAFELDLGSPPDRNLTTEPWPDEQVS